VSSLSALGTPLTDRTRGTKSSSPSATAGKAERGLAGISQAVNKSKEAPTLPQVDPAGAHQEMVPVSTRIFVNVMGLTRLQDRKRDFQEKFAKARVERGDDFRKDPQLFKELFYAVYIRTVPEEELREVAGLLKPELGFTQRDQPQTLAAMEGPPEQAAHRIPHQQAAAPSATSPQEGTRDPRAAKKEKESWTKSMTKSFRNKVNHLFSEPRRNSPDERPAEDRKLMHNMSTRSAFDALSLQPELQKYLLANPRQPNLSQPAAPERERRP
jgi:hypothetical protein